MIKWLLIMYMTTGVHVMEFGSLDDCRWVEDRITTTAIATECQQGRVVGDEYVINGAGAFIPKM